MNSIWRVIVLCLVSTGKMSSWPIPSEYPSAKAQARFDARQAAKHSAEAIERMEYDIRKTREKAKTETARAERDRQFFIALTACAGTIAVSALANNSNKVIRYGTRTLAVAACSAAGIQWVVDDGKN